VHNRARNTFVEIESVTQPAPAPRFSRTTAAIQRPPASPGEHTESVLRDWGFGVERVARLKATGVI
jgi:alpha-methylacyl-CoA racemase